MSSYTLHLYGRPNDGMHHMEEITPRAVEWRRSIRSIGGYWLGSFRLQGLPATELWDWFNNRMGCVVRELTMDRVTWEGYIYEMRLTIGGIQRTRSLSPDLFHNRVKIIYTLDDTKAETPWLQDDGSVALYGQMEYLISMGADTAVAVAALQATHLSQYAWPPSRMAGDLALQGTEGQQAEMGAPEEPQPDSLEITLAGFWSTLNWRYYEATFDAQATPVLEALVGLSEWLNVERAEPNTLQVKVEAASPQRLGDLVEKIIAEGDGAGNGWQGGIYAGRAFIYEPMPTQPAYILRGDRLLDGAGAEILPTMLTAGTLIINSDPASGGERLAGDPKNDPRLVYVEELEFQAPDTVTLRTVGVGEALGGPGRSLGTGTIENDASRLGPLISGAIASDSDKVDGFHANLVPTANMLLPLDGDAKWPVSTLNLATPSGLTVFGGVLAVSDTLAGTGLLITDKVISLDPDLVVDSIQAADGAFKVLDHEGHTHVVINPGPGWALDEQFGLDIDDNLLVRGYIVGKHALQVADALMICHFDGPQPFALNYTGEPTGHMGQVAVPSGGVIYRPGRFGKGVQVAEATTNLVLNPSFGAGLTNWNTWDAPPTLEVMGTDPLYGSQSLHMITNGPGQGVYTSFIAVTAGVPHTFSAWVKVASGQPSILTSDDSTFEYVYADPSWTGDGKWHRLTWTRTPATANVRIYLGRGSSGANGEFWFDGVQIEQKAYATPYCDGSLGNGHSWSGTAHASSSSRVAAGLRYDQYAASLFKSAGTICGWYVADTQTTSSYLILFDVRGAANTDRMMLQISDDLKFDLFVNGSFRIIDVGSGTLTPGAPYFWAVTYDFTADAYKLYVYGPDGTLYTGTSSVALNAMAGLSSFGVGCSYASTAPCNGVIDDLVILGRAAPADEITAIYKSNAPIFAETSTWSWRNPVGLIWADGEGLWAKDVSGYGALGVSAIDGKSWGGLTLDMGDVVLGHNRVGSAALMFDRSTGKLQFRGGGSADVHAEINTEGEFLAGEGLVKMNKDGFHLLGKSIYTGWGGTSISGTTSYFFGTPGHSHTFTIAGNYLKVNDMLGIVVTGTL